MPSPDTIKIKDYQIHLPALGEGTYGRVYHATYRGLSERALKVFRPGAVDIATMARELEKLSTVAEHNGIVTLHDFDLLNDPPYYAMGLHADVMRDGTLQTRTLERLCGHVDYQEGWRLIREIADAVSYLHRHQIVHCDLKPSNILLTNETPHHIKICDFGQSRGLAAAGFEPVGTPLYACPEQLRSPSDSAEGKGFRWDVYSFGVIAFKLLTGELPRLQALADAKPEMFDPDATVQEATISESLNELTGEKLATMVEAVEEIEWPPDVYVPTTRKLLLEQCLSLDPAKRPADMREVWSRIQERDHFRVVRRARRLNTVFALLLFAALWASAIAFTQAKRARKASQEALQSEKQAEELALIIVDELNRGQFSGSGADQIYSLIADHSEAFLDNLPKDRRSNTTLRFSAQTASMRGRQALDSGDLDEALKKYSNAYEIRSELGGSQMELLAAIDLMQLGRIHELKGEFEPAAESYTKAMEIRVKDFGSENEPSKRKIRDLAHSYKAMGNLHRRTGEPKKAIETFGEISTILLEASNEAPAKQADGFQREILPILSLLGLVQYENSDLRGAFGTFEKLAEVAEKIISNSPTQNEENREHYLLAIHYLGQIQLDRKEREKALNLFRDEIKLREKTARLRPYDPDLKVGLADAYQKAASCLDAEDMTARSLAVFYLEQSLSLLSSLPPDLRNSEQNLTRASIYKNQLNAMLEMDE